MTESENRIYYLSKGRRPRREVTGELVFLRRSGSRPAVLPRAARRIASDYKMLNGIVDLVTHLNFIRASNWPRSKGRRRIGWVSGKWQSRPASSSDPLYSVLPPFADHCQDFHFYFFSPSLSLSLSSFSLISLASYCVWHGEAL